MRAQGLRPSPPVSPALLIALITLTTATSRRKSAYRRVAGVSMAIYTPADCRLRYTLHRIPGFSQYGRQAGSAQDSLMRRRLFYLFFQQASVSLRCRAGFGRRSSISPGHAHQKPLARLGSLKACRHSSRRFHKKHAADGSTFLLFRLGGRSPVTATRTFSCVAFL